MQTSIIRQRVADFLKRFAPFDAVSDEALLELSGSGRVKFHESEEYIFRQGEPKGPVVWMIQQGRVELLEEGVTGEHLRDVLGEGDLLGLERFVNDGSFVYSARTASDVILYGVSASLFESLTIQYPAVQRFLAAHFSVSGMRGLGRTSWLDAEPPPAEFLRARLVALPADTSWRTAQEHLADANNGVVALVDEACRPLAVLTMTDLAGKDAGTARAAARPWRCTIRPSASTRDAVREMLRAGSEELAITTDGTPETRLEAILTATEVALFCGHNPVSLVNAIRRASSTAELMPLLNRATKLVQEGLAQPHDVDDCCSIAGEVIAGLASACIRLADRDVTAAGLVPPEIPYCWLIFGQAGRGDLLTPVLPAIAAVYDDSATGLRPEDSMYFTALAGETLGWFHACGLDGPGLLWPNGSLACMPLSEWKRLYSETIRNPLGYDLYARRQFFDLRALSGDQAILRHLQDHIGSELCTHQAAIPLLANDTLRHLPPLTFFRGLVLGLDGAQQDSFDVRSAAISPIADAARVFAMAARRVAPANTLIRLEAAMGDFPEGKASLAAAADAFRIAMYYEARTGGARMEPGKLGKFDQRLLKTAFHSTQRLLEFTASRFVANA